MKKLLLPALVLLGSTAAALAAGFYTNGSPTIPLVGTTSNPGSYGQLYGNELVPVDTQLPNGQNPASVAASAAQIGAAGACMASATGTASAGAVTKNTQCATITSESLTTAAGATYTLTITNSVVAATSQVFAGAWLGTSTAGKVQVQTVTPASGSVVVVVKNVGTAALNGTIVVPYLVYN